MVQKIKAYLKPNHQHAYVKKEIGLPEITGLYYVVPEPRFPSRLCYEVTFPDGEVDYVAYQDVESGYYKIVVQDTY